LHHNVVKKIAPQNKKKGEHMRLTLNRGCVVTGAVVLALLVGSLVSVAQQAAPKAAVRPGVVPGQGGVHHQFVSKHFPELLKEALNGVGVPSLVAVSDFGASFIDVFDDTNDSLVATLSGNGLSAPEGMDTDRLGNLYVCNAGNRDILIYAAGFTTAPTSIATNDGQCANVAQRNNGAFLGVTMIVGNNGTGGVSFFRNGVEPANGFATDPSILEAFNGDFDHNGNYYFDGFTQSGTVFVAVIAHATTGGRAIQFLTTGNTIGFPGDVKVTNGGLISIGDQGTSPNQVYTYNPPVSGALGNPVNTTVLTGSGDAVTFTYKVHNHHLYTADAVNLNSGEWAYPAGGNAENTLSISGASIPIGSAIIPVQIP
jgi:hypothetical protein